MTIRRVERIVGALGATVGVHVRWHGEQLDRLMDAAHAALQESTAELLTAAGWIARAEVSFNHYGDRGRVDLLAFHPRRRVVLVIEVKSAIGDIQDMLGRLDVKTRVAQRIAREVGWRDIDVAIPCLVIGDSRTARRLIAAHAALFGRFDLRGRSALAWIRRPVRPWPAGLLWFAIGPDSRHVTAAGVSRVRKTSDSQVA